MPTPNCYGCAHSGIEPDDMDLTCHHEKAGAFGKHVLRGPIAACGPSLVLFEQHPGRSADGRLLSCGNAESGEPK